MGNDTKTEPASPRVGYCQGLPDGVKAEVASLVQAALAKMQQPSYDCSIAKTVLPVAEISPGGTETESERRYKEIVSALEAKLSETGKQLGNTYRDLGDTRDQLEKQRAKSVQLEQRILHMSEAEGTLKSTIAVLRAEKDKALAREREALLSRDRAGMHNAQLLNQLTELQSSLDLKTAEFNDSIYIRQQLESRVGELNKENMSLRQATPSQGASTGLQNQPGVATGPVTNPQSVQPPSSLYFSVPAAGAARRHTAPNIHPTPPAVPTVPSSLPSNRPPKRSRADSEGSDGSENTRSRVSSASSTTFALRPVTLQPEAADSNQPTSSPAIPSNVGYAPQSQAYSPISPTAPPFPYPTQQQQQQSTYAAPIPHRNQGSYQTQTMVHQAASSAPPTMATAPSVTRRLPPSVASNPAQMMQPAPVQWAPSIPQFINQMYLFTPAGFPECKICKVRPLGHTNTSGSTMPPSVSDLLAHAENYHGRIIMPKPAQQQQT